MLSIVLGRHDDSTRFKEVVHPAPAVAVVREHLELEEVEAFDTDDDIWWPWQEEASAASELLNATALRRVLERIENGA